MKCVKLFVLQISLGLVASFVVANTSAEAQSWGYYVPDSKVVIKTKRTFSFDGWRHVRKVKIKVDGDVVYREKVKILANGVERAYRYSNGYYYLDVNEAISSLDIVPYAGGSYAIGGIYLDADEVPYRDRLPVHVAVGAYGYGGGAAELLNDVLLFADSTRGRVSGATIAQYLDPIYTSTVRCHSAVMGRGITQGALNCIAVVTAQIDAAEPILNEFAVQPVNRWIADGFWNRRILLKDYLRSDY